MISAFISAPVALADETVSAARAIGYAGAQAYENGDYADAALKLKQAFDMVKMPTLGLWYARTLVKLGKLVEAADCYREVTTIPVTSGKLKEQKQAEADAAKDLAALLPRIPELTLTAKGLADGVELTLDGAALPNETLGATRSLNPGVHHVAAKSASKELVWDIALVEADKTNSELDLTPLNIVAPAPTPSVIPNVAPTATRVPMSSPRDFAEAKRTAGWIVLGVGGAATAVGAITGLVVASKKGKLDDSGECAGTQCYASQRDLRESYNTMRIVSGTNFIVGAVALGAGATLLLTTRKQKAGIVARARLGVGEIGVEGAF